MSTITIECSHQEAHFNLVLGPGRDGNGIAYLLKDEDEGKTKNVVYKEVLTGLEL